jgi:hypothetical protein
MSKASAVNNKSFISVVSTIKNELVNDKGHQRSEQIFDG